MRLGIWNRLAIVAATLALAIFPTWFIISENIRFAETHEKEYQNCVALALKPNDGTLTLQVCREIWPIGGYPSYGWAQWIEMFIATFVFCILVYLIIWLMVWTARWVWRGRQLDQ